MTSIQKKCIDWLHWLCERLKTNYTNKWIVSDIYYQFFVSKHEDNITMSQFVKMMNKVIDSSFPQIENTLQKFTQDNSKRTTRFFYNLKDSNSSNPSLKFVPDNYILSSNHLCVENNYCIITNNACSSFVAYI